MEGGAWQAIVHEVTKSRTQLSNFTLPNCTWYKLYEPVCLWYRQKSGSLIPPALFLFLKIVLAIQGLLCLHTNVKIICSSFGGNAIHNLIGITLNLYIALGSMIIFKILILPIQEHYISFHLSVLCSFSFISVLQFSEFRSLISLVKLFLGILFFLMQL